MRAAARWLNERLAWRWPSFLELVTAFGLWIFLGEVGIPWDGRPFEVYLAGLVLLWAALMVRLFVLLRSSRRP